MKGEFTLRALEAVNEGATAFADVIAAIVELPYGASYGQLVRHVERRADDRDIRREKARRLQRSYILLHRLKKQGFVLETGSLRRKRFVLTRRGREKLRELLQKRKKQLPKNTAYERSPSARWTIVMFDIPEGERKKRDWLRSVLKHLGFTMKQKSVFVGKVGIPEAFLDDVRSLDIFDYVHILEVTKGGTLEEVK
jgi:phenylacetic acid degradation operon negative regulatory protein